MNITTKLIIPGLALLHSMSATNAANIEQNSADKLVPQWQHSPKPVVSEIISHNLRLLAQDLEKLDENYLMALGIDDPSNSYDFLVKNYIKYTAILSDDKEKLKLAFSDGGENVSKEEVNRKIYELSWISQNEKKPNTLESTPLDTYKELQDWAYSPLQFACSRDCQQSVEWLLENRANANEQGLLEIQCLSYRPDFVSLLFECRARLKDVAGLKKTMTERQEYQEKLHSETRDEERKKYYSRTIESIKKIIFFLEKYDEELEELEKYEAFRSLML